MAKKPATKRSPSRKKTTKASSSKKPASKKAGSKAPSRTASSKRSTSKKVATTKKKTAKKSASKASTAKKPTKKAPARKPSSKKSTSKRPAAKKPATRKPSKKTTTKKTTSKKAPARKPSAKPAAKPAADSASKKTSTRKSSARKPSSKASTSKAKSEPKPKSAKEKWKGAYTSDINSSVDAATRLAAAAGLRPLHERQTTLAADEDYERLTKTPYKKRELDRFKDILRLKRAQVTGDVNDMETEALIGRGSGSLSKLPQHMADAGSDTYDQTLNLDLAAGQRKLLKEIDDALARIENKTYGICELLGKPISKERLENTPWARYSIEAARRKEMLGY